MPDYYRSFRISGERVSDQKKARFKTGQIQGETIRRSRINIMNPPVSRCDGHHRIRKITAPAAGWRELLVDKDRARVAYGIVRRVAVDASGAPILEPHPRRHDAPVIA